jgi:stage V sporulation protein D (sporulation-specific penicillin-binding protein)
MEDALNTLEVKPRENQIEKEKLWNDPVMIEVPDVVGMTTKKLQTQLIELQLDISGTGTTVVKQTPEAGVKLKQGSTIRIYLGESED